jgi:phosphoserine aminotransferase
MSQQVYNFGAGPAMLPVPVMERIREEFLDFQGMGVSVIEVSHRAKQFEKVLLDAQESFRQLTNLPDNYKILFVHGGARMQFSALPMNLAARSASKKCLYVETGNFAKLANKDARSYGDIQVIASSAETNYDRLPTITPEMIDQDAAYLHITTNNTLYGSPAWSITASLVVSMPACRKTSDLPEPRSLLFARTCSDTLQRRRRCCSTMSSVPRITL